MKKNYLYLILSLFSFSLSAQQITGYVSDVNEVGLVGASVYWVNTNIGTYTEDFGAFELSTEGISDKRLVASFVGFKSDTIDVSALSTIEFKLSDASVFEEVVVVGQQDGVIFSNQNVQKIENITQTELKKAACCDLAGCFGTQSSVTAQTTNVITNAKELRILGLSGVYNQVLVDGFPMIQGLSYTYGISGIPGTLVDNIFIAQGANSVLQGYESISGQINVITKNPADTEPVLLNVYINNFQEKHFNANVAFKKEKWSNMTVFHTVQPASARDKDEDTFLDLPYLTRYMLMNKFQYRKSEDLGWSSMISARWLSEKRIGGQVDFNADNDQGSNSVYGQTVELAQPEFSTKTGYRFDEKNNLVFFLSGFRQNQNSYFGTVKYDAEQTNLYANVQYERNYNDHTLKTGVSYRQLDLEETIAFTNNDLDRNYDGDYQREEQIPGIFAENTMSFLDGKLTWIAGIRGDFHNDFGTKITPRTMLKYDLSSNATIRASIGTGWRTVNLFSENINLLVSSRDIVFEEALQPEEAINYGINYVQKFENDQLSGYFSADFYRTDFQNQIFPDYDSDPQQAIIRNFKGTSIGNGLQLETNVNFNNGITGKVGYNYLDVYRMNGEIKQQLPFNTKHKVLTTLGYQPKSKQYHIDMSVHWFGESRLPSTQSNPVAYQRPDFSEAYTTFNAQFTYNFKAFETYAGCENIFDFRQERPIISWEDPFGAYFDTSSVWGPTRGREFYFGIRYYLREE